MKNVIIKKTITALAAAALLAAAIYSVESGEIRRGESTLTVGVFAPRTVSDTIFTLGDAIIEISLADQTTTLRRRGDTNLVFKVSTGTSRLAKGVETPPGLFFVKNKAVKARSPQFNNAELFYWIGFNAGIGFHGLRGNSYYGYLGVKPSSHGCVRIAREDGEVLYDYVDAGSPVIVYDEKPARIVEFAERGDFDPAKDLKLKDNPAHREILRNRLENLYSGNAAENLKYKVFVDGATSIYPGFEVGGANRIAAEQDPGEPDNVFYLADTDHARACFPLALFAGDSTKIAESISRN